MKRFTLCTRVSRKRVLLCKLFKNGFEQEELTRPKAALEEAGTETYIINAGLVEGRKLTSYHSLQMDLKNVGAEWVDREVVVDNGLVTSRNQNDIPAFNRKVIEEFAEGRHAQ